MGEKTFLVTGGTGFIGAALVRRLLRDGYKVRVLDNNSRGCATRLADVRGDIEYVESDIRDAAAVEKAVAGTDSVCHLAYVNGTEFFYTMPDVVLDVAVRGMINVIQACLQHKVGELILASSSEVYRTPPKVPTDENTPLTVEDPLNPRYSYGGGKIISELMAINYGRRHFDRVLIFRPHNVYGPDMGWEHVLPQFVLRMKRLCSETREDPLKFPIQGTGTETRAFVFIDDFIDGLMVVIRRGEHLGIYNIGTQEEVSVIDVAHLVGEYYQRSIEVIPGELKKGAPPRRCPDISKVTALGYNPQYLLRDGFPILARWYDDNSDKAPSGQA